MNFIFIYMGVYEIDLEIESLKNDYCKQTVACVPDKEKFNQ